MISTPIVAHVFALLSLASPAAPSPEQQTSSPAKIYTLSHGLESEGQELIEMLHAQGIVTPALVGPTSNTPKKTQNTSTACASANQAVNALQPHKAIRLADDALRVLLAHVDLAWARQEAACLLRTQGRADDFLGEARSAKEHLSRARALDPDFTPNPRDWPPPLRALYAATKHPPASAAWSILPTPRAAEIWFDGRRLGHGPQTLQSLPIGDHLITLRSPGYRSTYQWVAVTNASSLQQIHIALRPDTTQPSPSHAALLAALWPARHHVRDNGDVKGPHTTTPAWVLEKLHPDGRTRLWLWRGRSLRNLGARPATGWDTTLIARLDATTTERIESYRWWPWAVGGAVAAAGITTTILLLRPAPDPGVEFVIGRTP